MNLTNNRFRDIHIFLFELIEGRRKTCKNLIWKWSCKNQKQIWQTAPSGGVWTSHCSAALSVFTHWLVFKLIIANTMKTKCRSRTRSKQETFLNLTDLEFPSEEGNGIYRGNRWAGVSPETADPDPTRHHAHWGNHLVRSVLNILHDLYL